MASFLNPYCNFIDVSMKDGQTLLSNSTNKFKSPLDGEHKISLRPGGKDYQNFKNHLAHLLQRFGYQYLLNDISTVATIIPATPAVIADPTASILAAPAVPASTAFSNPIKIMDVYSDKLLDISQKHALLTWGDGSFTNQTPRVISGLTQAKGHLTAAGQLTQSGKDIIQEQLHSKIMASQIFALLSNKA
jgi:hypothetical protein